MANHRAITLCAFWSCGSWRILGFPPSSPFTTTPSSSTATASSLPILAGQVPILILCIGRGVIELAAFLITIRRFGAGSKDLGRSGIGILQLCRRLRATKSVGETLGLLEAKWFCYKFVIWSSSILMANRLETLKVIDGRHWDCWNQNYFVTVQICDLKF